MANMNDVTEHLMKQMDRLANDELDSTALADEVRRADAMNSTAATITNIAKAALDARRFQASACGTQHVSAPEFFLGARSDE